MTFRNLLQEAAIYFHRKYPKFSKKFLKNNKRIKEWPKKVYGPAPAPPGPSLDSTPLITYVGHRTVYIQILGTTIITDPVFTRRLGYHGFGVKRVIDPPFLYQHVPPAHFLLLTNNSFSCINHTSLDIISACGACNILGGRNVTFYIQKDMRNYIYPMDYYDRLKFGELSITFLPSVNRSNRLSMPSLTSWIFHRPMLWGSFLIEGGGKLIYLSGATGYSNHFSEVSKLLEDRQLDLAILPVGPIEPSDIYRRYNLSIEDAEKAREDLGAKKTIPIGFDIFPLGAEEYGKVPNSLSNKFTILSPGTTISI